MADAATTDRYTADEMMSVVASRQLTSGTVCFVGIGLPSEAANLARLTHAPGIVLVYESGTIGSKPPTLPLSIGDGVLAETATSVVTVPEIFAYWLQGGRIDVGFLSAAQVDRFANLNSTVIGRYEQPRVRLPGSGGAAEIASCAGEVFIMVRHRRRVFVEEVDFITTVGFGRGGEGRPPGSGAGPTIVITDLGVMRPDPLTRELVLTAIHPGADVDHVRSETGWDLKVADPLETTEVPTDTELTVLRRLRDATEREQSA